MGDRVDYKNEHKDLYVPGTRPSVIDVPPMSFIMLDGQGDPSGEEYQQAIGLLYRLAYTIRMSKLSGCQPTGYSQYVIPPLEGLWWISGGPFDLLQT